MVNVKDSDFLNYENAQVLLIGTGKKDVQEELGIDLNEERETADTAELFKKLHLRKEHVPLKSLLKGDFPSKAELPLHEEMIQLSREEAPGHGGKIGGRAAATKTPSAAAIAKILSSVDFPKKKEELVRHAEENRQKVESSEKIIQLIRELPKRYIVTWLMLKPLLTQT